MSTNRIKLQNYSLILIFTLVTAIIVHAKGIDAPPPPLQPHEIVEAGISQLNQFIGAYKNPSKDQIRQFLASEIAPYFDFSYMAKWVAGPYHNRLSIDQKTTFKKLLHDNFLNALARNLGVYTLPLPQVHVEESVTGRNTKEMTVPVYVEINGLQIKLIFRFYWSPVGWKIFDVVANGASAVGFYRRYYVDLLRRHGPEKLLP